MTCILCVFYRCGVCVKKAIPLAPGQFACKDDFDAASRYTMQQQLAIWRDLMEAAGYVEPACKRRKAARGN